MEIFDKITKKASETYKGAAEKTGKIAKEAKLKIKINENKSKINSLYQEIGKKVYQKHVAKEDICIKKDLEEECTKIDILSSEIDSYHKEILSLSDIKVCGKCKEPMDKSSKYCPNCGEEQPNVEVIQKQEERQMNEKIVVADDTQSSSNEEMPQEVEQKAEENEQEDDNQDMKIQESYNIEEKGEDENSKNEPQ